jgi:hypothetical protein
MANITAGVFYILGASGYMTYTVKYLETQFQKSAAGANMIAGTVMPLNPLVIYETQPSVWKISFKCKDKPRQIVLKFKQIDWT